MRRRQPLEWDGRSVWDYSAARVSNTASSYLRESAPFCGFLCSISTVVRPSPRRLANPPQTTHASVMTELQQVLQQIRQEIESGLAQRPPASGGLELVAETVTLRLTLETDPGPEGTAPAPVRVRLARSQPSDPTLLHTLTLQFRLQSAGTPAPVLGAPAGPVASAGTPAHADDTLATVCESIFGRPGFDNSARAEVFCEWASTLPPGELQRLLEFAVHPPSGPIPSRDTAGLTRLRRLLDASPAGAAAAAQSFLDLLRRHPHELDRLLRRVAERWRFGTHWALPAGTTPASTP